MTKMLGQEEFDEHLGAVFHIAIDDDRVLDVTLIEVNDAGTGSAQQAKEAGRFAPFSIVFRGPAEPVLPQAIYRLSHKTLGAQELFLVPIGPEGAGVGYEAVFN